MARRDDEQYADFVAASQQRLRRTAYLMTGDWSLAADLTQEALIRVYVAWPRLERSGGLPTYARRALVSAVIDHRRRRWTQERPAQIEADDVRGTDPTGGVDDRELLMGALRRLPVRQRSCVVLRYFDELSVQETADAVGCSVGTVKSQTSRGIDALRRVFGEQGHPEVVLTTGEGRAT